MEKTLLSAEGRGEHQGLIEFFVRSCAGVRGSAAVCSRKALFRQRSTGPKSKDQEPGAFSGFGVRGEVAVEGSFVAGADDGEDVEIVQRPKEFTVACSA